MSVELAEFTLTPEIAAAQLRLRPDGKPYRGQDPLIRILGRCEVVGECWVWQGYRDAHGYGHMRRSGRGGPVEAPHRVLFTELNGPLPPHIFVCHTCDNPPCCNPAHLFAGTTGDNQRDRIAKGRYYVKATPPTTCRRGHAYDDENTSLRPDGSRICRACRRRRARAATSTTPSLR